VATGVFGRLGALNAVGLKRGGFSRQTLHMIRRAYRKLFFGEGLFEARLDAIEAEFGGDPAVAQIVALVRSSYVRSLYHPGGRYEGLRHLHGRARTRRQSIQ